MNSVDIDSGPDDIYSAAIILCLLAPYCGPTAAEVHGLCPVRVLCPSCLSWLPLAAGRSLLAAPAFDPAKVELVWVSHKTKMAN